MEKSDQLNPKRRIFFLIPSLRGGGAERTLINLLHKINYDSYEVDLVVAAKTGPYVSQVPGEVNVTYLFKNNFIVRLLGYIHRTFNIEWFFKKRMKKIEKEYDVGISFLDSNYTDLLFYTDNIKKRIVFVHGSYLTHSNYDKFYKFDHYREKLIDNRYSDLDGIYFVSHDSMADFVQLFGEYPTMGVVYNLIDRQAVIKKSKKGAIRLDNDQFTFSAAGSLIPIKGFDRLIRAAKFVRENGYNFKIHLAGTGPEEQNLRNMIREFNLENYVTLHGFLENPYPLMK